MSRSTEEDLGRRRFQIEKEKAVEDAYEKIRRSFGQEWQIFSAEDYAVLRDVLGEIWISVDRNHWKNYCFSTLSHKDIHALIDMGKVCIRQKCMTPEALVCLNAILGPRHDGS